MSCIDGQDPADFTSGVQDPGDDPSPLTSELIVQEGTYVDLGSTAYVEFEVDVSPIDYDTAVEFNFSTSNGSALAGTHYTARTAVHVIIVAGESLALLQVTVLKNSSFHGDKTFTITISSPTNATIGGATAVQTIHYDPAPPVSDPADLPSYNSWPSKITIYNEFADCTHKNECTGYAGAALSSAQEFVENNRKVTYDAHKLYIDSGGPTCLTCSPTCAGWYATKALPWMKATGVKELTTSHFRKIDSWHQLGDPTKSNLLKKIKRNVYVHGAVYLACSWYTDWQTAGSHTPHFILAPHGTAGSSIGHAVIIVGWNNNIAGTGIGGFLIQSSHGSGWGNNGRAWLRYSDVQLHSELSHATAWYAFYQAVLKSGA